MSGSVPPRITPKTLALIAMLAALAMIISYLERFIPMTALPGVKLGLANIVTLIALYTLGALPALAISALRILMAGFMFTGVNAMMYALAGGGLAFLGMVTAKRIRLFSIIGVSVVGAVAHNTGQIAVAALVVGTPGLAWYLPALIAAGAVTGVVTGLVGRQVTGRMEKIMR